MNLLKKRKTQIRTTKKQKVLMEFMKSTKQMNYKDLKRNVVVRGMEFDKVVNGDFPTLQNWLHFNRDKPINTDLLDQYDDYIDDILRQRGKHELIHPSLRLGYIGERDDEGNVITRKKVPKLKKQPKAKRERTKDGIFKGTKKAYVFESQGKGWSLKKTIRKTLARFPEASEKSIKIWFKKAEKTHA